jgi:hypothetical protein
LADAAVAVPCAARRTVIVARLAGKARGLTAVTTGRSVRGRRHGAFGVAIVPPRVGLREIRLTGRTRIHMHLPPAARQCGYTAAAFAALPSRAGTGRPAAAAPPPPAMPPMMSDVM